MLLVNDKRLMGPYVNGRLGNVLAWGAVALVVVLDAVLLGVTLLGALGVWWADVAPSVACSRRLAEAAASIRNS